MKAREIKFRAWDIVNKKMIYDVKCFFDYDKKYGVYHKILIQRPSFVQYRSKYIILESTWLFDKNNVEIYEGDILNSQNDGKDGCDVWDLNTHTDIVIQWDDEYKRLSGIESLLEETSVYSLKYIEVIGNIFQNKLNKPTGK